MDQPLEIANLRAALEARKIELEAERKKGLERLQKQADLALAPLNAALGEVERMLGLLGEDGRE